MNILKVHLSQNPVSNILQLSSYRVLKVDLNHERDINRKVKGAWHLEWAGESYLVTARTPSIFASNTVI